MARTKEGKDSKYKMFLKSGDEYMPIGETQTIERLPSGMYSVNINDYTGQVTFQSSKLTHDNLVDIPNPVYEKIVSEMDLFMSEEVKQAFQTEGFIYKRSTLLHGAPGTGKTCIINRVAGKVIDNGGIVLFNPEVHDLKEVFKILSAVQPDVLTMIVFEEFDETVSAYENELLSILDGQIQKNNLIVMATTNYIDKIPKRIQRPGRFSTVLEVKYPTEIERKFYLDIKMKTNRQIIPALVEMTEGFSIDELKEVVLSHACLKQPLDQVVKRISLLKGFPDAAVNQGSKKSFDWLDEEF